MLADCLGLVGSTLLLLFPSAIKYEWRQGKRSEMETIKLCQFFLVNFPERNYLSLRRESAIDTGLVPR